MNDDEDRAWKARKQRVRAALRRQGYTPRESRRRTTEALDHGTHVIADANYSLSVDGDLTSLEGVERWAMEGTAVRRPSKAAKKASSAAVHRGGPGLVLRPATGGAR